MTADLVAFLRARLDEDEQVARAAEGNIEILLAWIEVTDDAIESAEKHLDRQSTKRTLAEAEAKRRVIEMYEGALDFIAMMHSRGQTASHYEVAAESYLNVIKVNAALHADHPDYREEWRL